MSKQNYIIGVDVGGTKIFAGLVYDGKIIKRTKVFTEVEKGQKVVLENIIKAIQEIWSPKVKAIGVGFAGEINQKRGLVVSSPNFPKTFKNVKVGTKLKKKFKKPIYIDNDSNCFTLAEAIYGAAKNYQNVVGLTLGTGIGSGIVFNQKIYHGKDGLAAEWGHTTVVDDGITCSCGQKGHLESFASGIAMVRLYKKFTGKEKDTFHIEKMAKRRERAALQVLKIMTETLGIGLANIINALNPDIIVIGGGLSRVKILYKPAIKEAKKRVVYPQLKKTKIVKAKLGDKAGILGAALITNNNR